MTESVYFRCADCGDAPHLRMDGHETTDGFVCEPCWRKRHNFQPCPHCGERVDLAEYVWPGYPEDTAVTPLEFACPSCGRAFTLPLAVADPDWPSPST